LKTKEQEIRKNIMRKKHNCRDYGMLCTDIDNDGIFAPLFSIYALENVWHFNTNASAISSFKKRS